jgi:hypothetical protein
MNAYSIFIVNDHLEYLRQQAAADRAAKLTAKRYGRPSLGQRVASAFETLDRIIEGQMDIIGNLVPKMSDYPTRN